MIIGHSEIFLYRITVYCITMGHLPLPQSSISERQEKENSGQVGRFKPWNTFFIHLGKAKGFLKLKKSPPLYFITL